MRRTRLLTWPAWLGVLVLSLGSLGDTCRTDDPATPAPDGSTSASAPAVESATYAEASPAASTAAGESTPDAEVSPAAASPSEPETAAAPEWEETATQAEPAANDPAFEATVRPMLAQRCAPCHNPGGQMYARLPWDQAGVVAANAAGIKRRLKGDDLKALEEWLASR